MKSVTLSYYLVPTGSGKTKRTTYRLSADEAAQRFPGAEPCPFDALVVDEPETADEHDQVMRELSTGQLRS